MGLSGQLKCIRPCQTCCTVMSVATIRSARAQSVLPSGTGISRVSCIISAFKPSPAQTLLPICLRSIAV